MINKKTLSLKESLELLEKHWPKLFSIDDPKPFKKNIYNEMIKNKKLSPNDIGKALKKYCKSPLYIGCIAYNTHYFDLHGRRVGRIPEIVREEAREKIIAIERKIYKKCRKYYY